MDNNDNFVDALTIALDIYDKTIGSEIEPLRYEDIPGKLEEILSKYIGKRIKVNGDGLTSDITCDIK